MIVDELRRGAGDTLFMICGAGGASAELAGVARALRGDPRVIALVPHPAPGGAEPATTVEALAADAVAAIRSHQPSGPYRLLGYSLGGIVALEVGRALQEDGERVSFLGLVDSFFDQRYWPRGLFLRGVARRSAVHAGALLGKPPAGAWRELRERTRRLAVRLRDRFRTQGIEDGGPAGTALEANLLALARWRPRLFGGEAVLFAAETSEFGCDLADLWRPWLPRMQVRRVPGSHVDLVRDPVALARLAETVDEAIAESAAPRLHVLVATTFRWSGAARLAVELHASGCVVRAIGPPGSALHEIAAVERSYPLGLINPAGGLRRAIESCWADLIIPFDDRTRRVMQGIHADADPTTEDGARLRSRLERSLGSPDLYGCVYSRVAVMDAASEGGVRCPPTAAVESSADIAQWLAEHPGPAVVKTDGSWGGRGTRVIRTEADGRRAWRQLSRSPGFARCVKRLLIERDPWPLRSRLARRRPHLSIQSFVDGKAGNAAVACVDGEVLGAVQAAVVKSKGPTGPSTVLRVIEHPEMLAAARTMVRRLQMTGLVGLDFILEDGTGRAHLIEINPRATPTSHLVSAEGVDLLASLRSALGYPGPAPRAAPYRDGYVALFPGEMERDPAGKMLGAAYHDVPWLAPDLVEHAIAELRVPGAREIRDRLVGLVRESRLDDRGAGPPVCATSVAPTAAARPGDAAP